VEGTHLVARSGSEGDVVRFGLSRGSVTRADVARPSVGTGGQRNEECPWFEDVETYAIHQREDVFNPETSEEHLIKGSAPLEVGDG
jgi:hypothetical protein